MSWDGIEADWEQRKNCVKQRWARLTDDQLNAIAGRRERLTGKIQEQYGISRDEAEKQLGAWQVQQKLDRARIAYGK